MAARLLRYALRFPLWGDEAFVAIDLLIRDFGQLFDPLTYRQFVPLAFMAVELAAARALGTSEWAVRLFPLLCGCAALVLFWRFMARDFGPRVTLLAVGFLAAAYYPIRHAVEVKPYATDLFVAVLLLWLARDVLARPGDLLRWLLLGLAAGACVWCSYPAAFVGGGIGLTLTVLLARRYSTPALVGWIVYGLAICGSFAVMWHTYGGPHAAAGAKTAEIPMWTETFPPIDRPLRFAWWLVESHIGNLMAYPIGGRNGGSILTTVLVFSGIVTLWRTRRELLLLLLSPVPLNFIAALLHKYPYGGSARVSQFLAPAICLLAAVGLFALIQRFARPLGDWLRRRTPGLMRRAERVLPGSDRRRLLYLAAGGFALVCAGGMVRDVIEPFKKDANAACRRVIRELSALVSPHDRVLIFMARDDQTTFAPYAGVWKGDGAAFLYYMHSLLPAAPEFVPPPDKWITAARLSSAPSATVQSTGRVWLVIYRGVEFERLFNGYADLRTAAGTPTRHFAELLDGYRAALDERFGPPTLAAIGASSPTPGSPSLARTVLQRKWGYDLQVLEIECYRRSGP